MEKRKVGNYELARKIGSGASSTVYLGGSKKSNKVAVKIFDSSDMHYFLNEINVYTVLGNCKYIAEFVSAGVDLRQSDNSKAFPYIVTKYYSSTLSKMLRQTDGGFKYDTAMKYATEIAGGIKHMHDRNIIHADVKLGNVYVEDGHARLGDFGACSLSNEPFSMEVGTIPNIPIELLYLYNYDSSVDIWEFMCCLYEMLTGARLFEIDDVGLDESSDDDAGDEILGGDSSDSMSSRSFDDVSIDYDGDKYRLLAAMQDVLGSVPKKFYTHKYHVLSEDGILLRDWSGSSRSISDGLKCKQKASVEAFLLQGLQYLPEKRINIDQVLAGLAALTAKKK
jgi:serine/threonine protein kinase